MYATDCNFQNILRNEEKINKLNLKHGVLSVFQIYNYTCTYK
jgi:hypothetical protein